MRYPFVLAFGALAAGCAAPPEASPPEPSPPALEALGPAPAVSEADAGPLESSLDDRALDFTPSEPIGEAQATVAWPLVVLGACWVAGT